MGVNRVCGWLANVVDWNSSGCGLTPGSGRVSDYLNSLNICANLSLLNDEQRHFLTFSKNYTTHRTQ